MKTLRPSLYTAVLLSIVYLTTGCGGSKSVGTYNGNDSVKIQASQAATTAETPNKSASIAIPAGALSGTTEITISPIGSPNVPDGIKNCYQFEPSGLVFNSQVSISLKYDLSQFPEGTTAQDLTIAYVTDDLVTDMENPVIDSINNTISVKINHFSPYGVKLRKSGTYGTALGNYNGIVNVSNQGGPTIRDFFGLEYMCVEYVNRYYYEIYGYDGITTWNKTGNACDYYENKPRKYSDITPYRNGGDVPPAPGDIMVWGSSAIQPEGHVAIVRTVSDTGVTVIQQNVRQNTVDANYPMVMTVKDGKYRVQNELAGGVVGWLRTSREANKVIIADDNENAFTGEPRAAFKILGLNGLPPGEYEFNEGLGYLKGYHFTPNITDSSGFNGAVYSFYAQPGEGKVDVLAYIPATKFKKSKLASYTMSFDICDVSYADTYRQITIDQSSVNDKWVTLFTDVTIPSGCQLTVSIPNQNRNAVSGTYIVYDAVKIVNYPW